MTSDKSLFSLDDFLAANKGQKLGAIDYLHAQFKLADLSIDLVFCFIKMLMPEFRVVDGLVFLDGSFDADTYNRFLREGKNGSEIQLWTNLFEITGVFEKIEEQEAIFLANAVARMWNLKLVDEVVQGAGKARVIDDEGEVFVTIDQVE